MSEEVFFEVPVAGTLQIRLANGDVLPATPAQVSKFGYVRKTEVYRRFVDHLTTVLRDEDALPAGGLTEAHLNPVRALLETVVYSPDVLGTPDMAETNEDLVFIEHQLNDHDQLVQEIRNRADQWEKRAADLRNQVATRRLDPEHAQSLTDEALMWEDNARALRAQAGIEASA